MPFPRTHDGSLDFDAFEMLSDEGKKEAVLFVKQNHPDELKIVRAHIIEHKKQTEARIAERDARIAEREARIAERDARIAQREIEIKEGEAFIEECLAQNRVLAHMREQYVKGFTEDTAAALNVPTENKSKSKDKCTIM